MLQNIQTLHCHTTISDGEMAPVEVLDECEKAGVRVVALTDHDAVPDEKTVQVLMNKKDHATKWVMGIEISSGYPKDKGGGPADLLHVVGLFVDPFNKKLLEFCRNNFQARIERILRTIKNLQKLGFSIKEDECLELAGERVISRNHVAELIINKKGNMKIVEKYWQRMQQVAQSDAYWAKICQKVRDEGGKQKVFELFLLERSYVPGIYEGLPYWLNLESTVDLIHQAGGLALFAHPDPSILSWEEMEKILAEDKIDGMEVVFSLFERGTHLEEENRHNMRRARQIVEKYGKLAGGGVDLHKRKDLWNFVKDKEFSDQTVGMIERVVEMSGVNTEWSSL